LRAIPRRRLRAVGAILRFPLLRARGRRAAGAALEAPRDLQLRRERRQLRLHPDQSRVRRPRHLRPRRRRARAARRPRRRLAPLQGAPLSRDRLFFVVFCLLAVATALPIWLVEYLPLLDL